MADAAASKAAEGNLVGVQLPSPAPFCFVLWCGKLQWGSAGIEVSAKLHWL